MYVGKVSYMIPTQLITTSDSPSLVEMDDASSVTISSLVLEVVFAVGFCWREWRMTLTLEFACLKRSAMCVPRKPVPPMMLTVNGLLVVVDNRRRPDADAARRAEEVDMVGLIICCLVFAVFLDRRFSHSHWFCGNPPRIPKLQDIILLMDSISMDPFSVLEQCSGLQ